MARDYNKEFKDNERKYAYNFDFDVMHKFMIRAMEPFFLKYGNAFELGSFKGELTSYLYDHFAGIGITCIEASKEASDIAKEKFAKYKDINIINARFEDDFKLGYKADHIIITHVLEHLDDPVAILKKAKNKWLKDNGRIFIICPNANAPSRQIAVQMGLISHNSAITKAEENHGHRITYTLDTLERDARAAGLKIIHRSGIFFKALANFQWDKLLETDIISQEYLEGCYQLGMKYPDLCSSIFLVCEKA